MQREVILCFPLKRWGPLLMLQLLVSFWGNSNFVYHRLATELLMLDFLLHERFTACLFFTQRLLPCTCSCFVWNSFTALIKLIECNQEGGKGTHMWTGARMLGSQGCFFSLGDFFFQFCFPLVWLASVKTWQRCAGSKGERERRLFCSSVLLA